MFSTHGIFSVEKSVFYFPNVCGGYDIENEQKRCVLQAFHMSDNSQFVSVLTKMNQPCQMLRSNKSGLTISRKKKYIKRLSCIFVFKKKHYIHKAPNMANENTHIFKWSKGDFHIHTGFGIDQAKMSSLM